MPDGIPEDFIEWGLLGFCAGPELDRSDGLIDGLLEWIALGTTDEALMDGFSVGFFDGAGLGSSVGILDGFVEGVGFGAFSVFMDGFTYGLLVNFLGDFFTF